MKYVEAPNEIPKDCNQFPVIFLAGGITGCEEWQTVVKHALEDKDVVILNPRRANFPIHDPNAAQEQITWEYNMLRKATCISFWFSKETIQPIVLYELGTWSMFMETKPLSCLPEKLIISIHPEYSRKQDVMIQSNLQKIYTTVCYLHDHVQKLREYVDGWWRKVNVKHWVNYFEE